MESHQLKGSNYYTSYHIEYVPEARTNPTRGGIYHAPCTQSTAVSLCGYQETDAILGTVNGVWMLKRRVHDGSVMPDHQYNVSISRNFL